jgi:hypothetical protein
MKDSLVQETSSQIEKAHTDKPLNTQPQKVILTTPLIENNPNWDQFS